MKLHRLIFILLISVFFFSCSPQKSLNRKIHRAQKYAKKHDLTTVDTIVIRDTIRDTVSVTTELVKLDTVFSLNEVHDTVTIIKDNLTIRYYRDTARNEMYISGECDTIFIEVPFEKIVEYKVPCDAVVVNNKIWWWYWIILILILAIAVSMAKELLRIKKS